MLNGRTLIAVIAAAGMPIAAAGQTTSWQDALDGTWLDALRWDNGLPGPGIDVMINATGAAYTSRVTSDFTINNLTLDSADALLRLEGGSRLDVTGTIDLLAGEMHVANGVIAGGTLNNNAGLLTFNSTTLNALDGVTLIGDLVLDSSSSTVRLLNNTSVSGAVRLTGNNSRVGFDGSQTFGGEIVQEMSNVSSLTVERANTQLTLSNSALVRGNRMDIGSAFFQGGTGRSIVNQGEIRAEGANATGVRVLSLDDVMNEGTLRATGGGRLQVQSSVGNFTNAGMVVVESGSRIDIGGSNWTSTGSMNATDGLIALSGSYSTSGSGLDSGGITGDATSMLSLAGTIDNAGSTIRSDAFGGTILFNGASVVGGEYQQIMSDQVEFSSSSSNVFDGVSVTSDLELAGSNATLRLLNGSGVSGTIRLLGNSSRLGFDGTQTFNGEIVQEVGNIGQVTVERAGSDLTLSNSALLRGTRMDIGNAFFQSGAGRTILNQGEIRAEAANGNGVRVTSLESFTNEGTLRATNGGRVQVLSSVGNFANDGMFIVEASSRGDIASSNWTNNGSVNVTDGQLFLSGSYSTSGSGLDSGGITGNAGSSLTLGGTLDNSGATLRSDAFGGTMNFNVVTVSGGMYEEVLPGQSVFSSSGQNVFDGVSVVSDLTLAGSSSSLRLRNGSGVTGTINLIGNSSRIGFENSQMFGGEIVQSSGSSGLVTVERANSELTLTNSALVRGTRIDIGGAFAVGGAGRTIVNQGEVRAEAANSTGVRLTAVDVFTNEGTLRATNGGRLQVLSSIGTFNNDGMFLVESGSRGDIASNNWTNSGNMIVTDGELFLAGMYTTAETGLNANRITGDATSTLNLAGTIDNSGSTLRSDAFGGTINFNGATVNGGMYDEIMPGEFLFSSSGSNIFDGVSIMGDLTLGNTSSTLRLRNGSAVSGTINMTGNGARLGFEDSQTFGGEIVQTASNSQVTVERAGSELTLSNTALISGRRIELGSAFAVGGANRSIVNEGEIRANIADGNGVRAISLESLTNDGTLRATNGGRFQVLSTVNNFANNGMFLVEAGSRGDIASNNWTNSGTINVTDGLLVLTGSYSTSGSGLDSGGITGNAGADLNLGGSIDNTGSTLRGDAFGGTINYSSAVLTGGVFEQVMPDLLVFNSSTANTFDGVDVQGDLTLGDTFSTLRLRNGSAVSGVISLAGNGARIGFENSQTFNGEIVQEIGSSASITVERMDTLLTIGNSGLIRGGRIDIGNAVVAGGANRSLLNQGEIRADTANTAGIRLFTLEELTNEGVFSAVNGGRLNVLSSVNDFTNLDMGTLTGGTYRVGGGSRMDLNGDISVNNANIELLGAGAEFIGLEALARNEGSLTVGNDASLALDGGIEFAGTSELNILVAGADDIVIVPLIDAMGVATLGGALTLDFSGYAGITDGTFRFLDADAFAGDWASINVVGINADLVTFDGGPGTFTLTVPAPASGLALLVCFAAARRRNG